MKGIELSRAYYEAYGRPVLEREFGELMNSLAVGFTGSGSERFGYDDELSRDHDFEPGFIVFIPEAVDERTEFRLSRAYAKLPREFDGFKRSVVSPVGGGRNGVVRTADFFTERVGSASGELTMEQWLSVPQAALAEATNGEIFFDGLGEVTAIRARLSDMPGDAVKKRLAGNLITMAQAGQYNYPRCLAHGEPEAAQLALNAFTDSAINAFFLLKKAYRPFYKWSFRALRALPHGGEFSDKLAALMSGDIYDEAAQRKRIAAVEDIAAYIIAELKAQALTEATCGDLEKHAYSVNDGIKDGNVRNMSIFAAM